MPVHDREVARPQGLLEGLLEDRVARSAWDDAPWDSASSPAGRLFIESSDIRFHNRTPREVVIELTVRNVGDERSVPRTVRIEAAPFGAFLRWRPLGRIAVPPIEPDGQATVRAVARTSIPQVSPATEDRVLGTEPRDRKLVAWAFEKRASPVLPADLFRLHGRGGVHWAGNLNVFIEQEPVERHRAQAHRIYPGRLNGALFMVGSGPDAYSFRLGGEGAEWDAVMGKGLFTRASLQPVEPSRWMEVTRRTIVSLVMRPPPDATTGSLDVHVTQRSTGRETVVEFSLDAEAAGPGCYVVDE